MEEKLDDFLSELMENPKFKKEYTGMEEEFKEIRKQLDAEQNSSSSVTVKANSLAKRIAVF